MITCFLLEVFVRRGVDIPYLIYRDIPKGGRGIFTGSDVATLTFFLSLIDVSIPGSDSFGVIFVLSPNNNKYCILKDEVVMLNIKTDRLKYRWCSCMMM